MKIKLIIAFFITVFVAHGQTVVSTIEKEVTQQEVEAHVRFLASDELLGRKTGTLGIDVAAAYLAAYFEANNIKKLPGMDSYFQEIKFYKSSAPKEGTITVGDTKFAVGENFTSQYSNQVQLNGNSAFVDFGSESDIKKAKVKDKIIFLMAGEKDGTFQKALSHEAIATKLKTLEDAGAKAVIILWHFTALPWQNLEGWLNRETLTTTKPTSEGMPYFFLDATNQEVLKNFQKQSKTEISFSGRDTKEVISKNVIGYIEGSDPNAANNNLLLGAHYDHIGGEFTESDDDKIFNGARDNAVGTMAIMMAGEYFVKNKPKNSVILALWTAEEEGLLGSKYFADNSPIDLSKIYYNLNIDGAGYNDTTKVTVVGLDRTLAEQALIDASSAFGLTAITDPAPEQNLFDRSDNVNFARQGIPAPTFSLGFTAFDKEIGKYYHNVADEAETVDFNYVTKYTRAFVLAASKIANKETETFWKSGDKYEEAGKKLYNK